MTSHPMAGIPAKHSPIALFKSIQLLFSLLLLIAACMIPESATGRSCDDLPQVKSQQAVIQETSYLLPSPLSAECDISIQLFDPLIRNLNAVAWVQEGNQVLSFSLDAAVALPPNKLIATIQISIPGTESSQQYAVWTDSGGVMVILSDF